MNGRSDFPIFGNFVNIEWKVPTLSGKFLPAVGLFLAFLETMLVQHHAAEALTLRSDMTAAN